MHLFNYLGLAIRRWCHHQHHPGGSRLLSSPHLPCPQPDLQFSRLLTSASSCCPTPFSTWRNPLWPARPTPGRCICKLRWIWEWPHAPRHSHVCLWLWSSHQGSKRMPGGMLFGSASRGLLWIFICIFGLRIHLVPFRSDSWRCRRPSALWGWGWGWGHQQCFPRTCRGGWWLAWLPQWLFPWIERWVLELPRSILGLSHQEECLFAELSHSLLALEQSFHDLLELFLQGICLSLEQLVTLPGGCYFLLEELHVPKYEEKYILLAVTCWLIRSNNLDYKIKL